MSKRTKAQLEQDLEVAESELDIAQAEFENFREIVRQALNTVISNTCEESHDHIINFCNDIGIDPPIKNYTVKLQLVELPIGASLDDIKLLYKNKEVGFERFLSELDEND